VAVHVGHIGGVLPYKLLVTGCGRSGTRYLTFLLRRLGLDVRHERLGRDGIASWTMAVDAERRPYGPPSSMCSFEQVFHQVRHPLAVIGSVTTFGPESWAFVCEHTPCHPDQPVLLRAATYWLHWTAEADRIATWRYRVEAIDDVLPELCRRLEVECDVSVLASVPRDVNTRSRGRLLHLADELGERVHVGVPAVVRQAIARDGARRQPTWADLAAMDAELAERIRARAREYGYGNEAPSVRTCP
jgi:hypothetical protein